MMSRRWGWTGLIAGAALAAGLTGAHAAAEDMKACAAVNSDSVRLACFDAAVKDVQEGDPAACAKVSSDSVRLACFDAASGRGVSSAPAPSATTADEEEMARLEQKMRAREEAMRARVRELQQQAAEVERRAAEIERRTAAVQAKKAEKADQAKAADPVDRFGSKYVSQNASQADEQKFGDRRADSDDPLTAKTYGKAVKQDDDKKDKKRKKIVVKITNIDEGPYGKVKVTLANGQVWKQIDSSPARWNKDGGNVAHIRRAFLGSFLMTINDEGAALRVRRVK